MKYTESIREEKNVSEVFNRAMRDKDFLSAIERIEKSNAEQAKYARRQYRMSQVTAFASLLMLGTVVYTIAMLIPKINVTYQNIELVMENLRVITSDLAEMDLSQTIEGIEKLNAIDIDSLNSAIKNLSDTVEPFADLFNRSR